MLFIIPPKVYRTVVRAKNVWLAPENLTLVSILSSHDSTWSLSNGISPQTVIISKRSWTDWSAHIITFPSVWMTFKPPYNNVVYLVCVSGTHVWKHKETCILTWGHMVEIMRRRAFQREDTWLHKNEETCIYTWGHMINNHVVIPFNIVPDIRRWSPLMHMKHTASQHNAVDDNMSWPPGLVMFTRSTPRSKNLSLRRCLCIRSW